MAVDLMTDATNMVSIIIPTRNSAATLERCLESVRAQTFEPIEIVVVDNFSTDGTKALAEQFAQVVVQAGPERSAQRNRGAADSTGDYVLMIDSDMELSPTVVAECVACAQRDGAVAVTIPERSIGEGLWTAAKALERSCYVGDDTIEAPRFFTREVFNRYGGYDEAITGVEDWDLPARMRGKEAFGRATAEILHLEGRIRLGALLRKKYYYGKGLAGYMRRHPKLARRQLVIVRPAFLRHWRRLGRRPLLTAAMLFMKTAEFAAGGLGALTEAVARPSRQRR